MSKVLYIGDPHATVDALEDCQALVDLVVRSAQEHRVDRVVFLGDQYHHHGIVHVEVMQFWKRAFSALRSAGAWEIVVLLGNHDAPNDQALTAHALLAHDGDGIQSVLGPIAIENILHLPYYHDGEEFKKACRISDANTGNPYRVVVCHQEFDGSRFDNGFYVKGGVDPVDIPQDQVISGHIHSPQETGKVWYVGAPRWRTLSDANLDRAIWVVEHGADGMIKSRVGIDTAGVCRRIEYHEDTPEAPLALSSREEWQYVIDIKGPADFVTERKGYYKETLPGARIRTFVTARQVSRRVRESEGLEKSFGAYIKLYTPPNGTPADELQRMVQERLHVAVA